MAPMARRWFRLINCEPSKTQPDVRLSCPVGSAVSGLFAHASVRRGHGPGEFPQCRCVCPRGGSAPRCLLECFFGYHLLTEEHAIQRACRGNCQPQPGRFCRTLQQMAGGSLRCGNHGRLRMKCAQIFKHQPSRQQKRYDPPPRRMWMDPDDRMQARHRACWRESLRIRPVRKILWSENFTLPVFS